MLETFLGMLRKRRRVDANAEPNTTTENYSGPTNEFWDSKFTSATTHSQPLTTTGSGSDSCSGSGGAQHTHIEIDRLAKLDPSSVDNITTSLNTNLQPERQQHQQPDLCNTETGTSAVTNKVYFSVGEQEDMEIDSTTVPPPQEYSDCPTAVYQSESSMNFDYLQSLHEGNSSDTIMDSTTSSTSQRHFCGIGIEVGAEAHAAIGHVDDSKALDRFVTVLDQLDARVEKFRKDALGLQEKRDFLLMSVDLIRSHDLLQNMNDSEREEIVCYIQRVNSRLSTVELNVRTVRDPAQEDALSQINALIDMMITMGDPVISRQRCQQYLNACCSSMEALGHLHFDEASRSGIEMDIGPVDKKFESVLLGCTLDDQKNIKKRLQALMNYLNKQTIRNHPF